MRNRQCEKYRLSPVIDTLIALFERASWTTLSPTPSKSERPEASHKAALILRGRSGTREGLGPCRSAADQADHNTDQSVPRHVPVLQGTRHRPGAGRHARRLAVRPGIKAAVAYLHGCQMVSFKRLTELCEGLFGLTISQGAISNMLAYMGKPFGAAAEQIAATVRGSEVIASDETSARVKGKTHWQWTFGCAAAVYHVIAPTRGKCVPTDFLAGARPKVWLSDRLPAQCTHAEARQFCLAHLIRDCAVRDRSRRHDLRTAVQGVLEGCLRGRAPAARSRRQHNRSASAPP